MIRHNWKSRGYKMSEAFVYLWYDALNKMYYLGKHKGSPDDKYTHSSTIWERFTKDNIPEGVTREIISEGTDEEMCILEHELLVKAKNSGDWDRYYNESLGDPRYVDQHGNNNPNFKHGVYSSDDGGTTDLLLKYKQANYSIKKMCKEVDKEKRVYDELKEEYEEDKTLLGDPCTKKEYTEYRRETRKLIKALKDEIYRMQYERYSLEIDALDAARNAEYYG